MAYYSGVANDMAAVRQALIDACVGEGWLWSSSNEVLHKGVAFVRLTLSGNFLRIIGRTSLTAGDAPSNVQVGPFTVRGTDAMTFPVSYKIFLFNNEVYCVINYNIEFFQWFGFGVSTVQLTGAGLWFAASGMGSVSAYGNGIFMNPGGGTTASPSGIICPGIFWATQNNDPSYFVNTNFDGKLWALNSDLSGVSGIAPLVSLQPNSWNSEAVLLPARLYVRRQQSKVSLAVDLKNLRITRCNNYDPGQIVVIGQERWIVFPCYKKNSKLPDGGYYLTDSGTFAHAIRYEGP